MDIIITDVTVGSTLMQFNLSEKNWKLLYCEK